MELLGNLLLRELVALGGTNFPPRQSCSTTRSSRATQRGSASPRLRSDVVRELDAHLSDLIYRVVRWVFFDSTGADDDEEDTSEELRRVRRAPTLRVRVHPDKARPPDDEQGQQGARGRQDHTTATPLRGSDRASPQHRVGSTVVGSPDHREPARPDRPLRARPRHLHQRRTPG